MVLSNSMMEVEVASGYRSVERPDLGEESLGAPWCLPARVGQTASSPGLNRALHLSGGGVAEVGDRVRWKWAKLIRVGGRFGERRRKRLLAAAVSKGFEGKRRVRRVLRDGRGVEASHAVAVLPESTGRWWYRAPARCSSRPAPARGPRPRRMWRRLWRRGSSRRA